MARPLLVPLLRSLEDAVLAGSEFLAGVSTATASHPHGAARCGTVCDQTGFLLARFAPNCQATVSSSEAISLLDPAEASSTATVLRIRNESG